MHSAIDDPWLLLEFPDRRGEQRSLCFVHPVAIVAAHTIDQVRPALHEVQRAVRSGLYAAGYLAYEAAPAFDPAFVVHPGGALPLLWFGLFRAPAQSTRRPATGPFQLSEWRPTITRAVYDQAIAAIRAAIERGATYQVNYTLRLRADFVGDDVAFYRQIRAAQGADYCGYVNLGRYRIVSASPELFFRWQDGRIITKPMKGTARRGRWSAEDRALEAELAASEKNRAENLMIVDLLRNDLGRIADIGTVAVPHLFAIERYRTLHQMTSTVTARVRSGTTLEDVFAALFPCGSITGAPKIETMKLIAGLEDTPRGVYCGGIGFMAPDGEAVFNVAIRTATIDMQTGIAEYGVGGGITWDSRADDEYAEALLKAAVLIEAWPAFELLETLRLEQGNYTLLDRHVERLLASARYFSVPLAAETLRAALDQHARAYAQEARRVRVVVAMDGTVRVESQPLPPPILTPQPIALARVPISQHNRFLYHKTTNRAVYDAARSAHPDCFDVLLWNEAGAITEFCNGNVVVEYAGERWTPPIECGLLPGTFRAELIERGEIRERVLTRADIAEATRCWLINSVRGWVEVALVR